MNFIMLAAEIQKHGANDCKLTWKCKAGLVSYLAGTDTPLRSCKCGSGYETKVGSAAEGQDRSASRSALVWGPG